MLNWFNPEHKTWKRETAIGMLVAYWIIALFTAGFIAYGTFVIKDSVQMGAQLLIQLLTLLLLPTFAFAAAAFGIDAFYKQDPKRFAGIDTSSQSANAPADPAPQPPLKPTPSKSK